MSPLPTTTTAAATAATAKSIRNVFLFSVIFIAIHSPLPSTLGCFDCEFSCYYNGHCVSAAFICNGVNDCGDNSDEINCSRFYANPVPLQEDFLVVAGSLLYPFITVITQISLKRSTYITLPINHNANIGPATGIGNVAAVAVDPIDRNIFWTESFSCYRVIARYSLQNQTTSLIYVDSNTNTTRPTSPFYGLAVDPTSNKLYYTDTDNGRVVELSFNGLISSRRFIDSETNSKPDTIVFDSSNRTLYWTDWQSLRPGIYRSSVTGDGKTRIISGNMSQPWTMAIDFNAREIYWGDSYTHRIERANLDGTGRTILRTETIGDYRGMALTSTYLYFTNWASSYIWKLHRTTFAVSVASQTVFYHANGIAIFSESNFTTTATAATRTTTTTTTRSTTTRPSTTTARPTIPTTTTQRTVPTTSLLTSRTTTSSSSSSSSLSSLISSRAALITPTTVSTMTSSPQVETAATTTATSTADRTSRHISSSSLATSINSIPNTESERDIHKGTGDGVLTESTIIAIAVVVGAVAIVGIIAVVILLLFKKRLSTARDNNMSSSTTSTTPSQQESSGYEQLRLDSMQPQLAPAYERLPLEVNHNLTTTSTTRIQQEPAGYLQPMEPPPPYLHIYDSPSQTHSVSSPLYNTKDTTDQTDNSADHVYHSCTYQGDINAGTSDTYDCVIDNFVGSAPEPSLSTTPVLPSGQNNI